MTAKNSNLFSSDVSAENDSDASVANGQFTIKQLTHMMLTGKSNEVMQYIRTLPKEQMHQVRMKLIRNLEAIQQKNKKKKEDVDEEGDKKTALAFALNRQRSAHVSLCEEVRRGV